MPSTFRSALCLGLLATVSAFPGIALAKTNGETAETEERSDEVVVTGKQEKETPLAAQAIEYGNQVQIIDSQQIATTGATNFAEIAQFLIKGANVGYSPDEGEYTIRLDGGSDRDTLVVLDGVPLYDRGPALEDIWGTTTIDPHMIERVEVFRGGNSLFFGSNGGIGVISLVTKRPDGTSKFEFGGQYGSFNTREIWGNASFPLDSAGRHSVMVYGGTIQTDGPRIFAPESYVDNVAAAGGIQKYPLNRSNIGLKYLFKVDDKSEFRIGGQYTQIEFQDPFPDKETYSPNRVRYPIVDFTLDRRWSDRLYTEIAGYWSNPQLNNTETFAEICKIATGCPDPSGGKLIPFGNATGKSIPYPNKGFGKESKVGGFRELGFNFRNTLTLPNLFELVTGVQIVSYKNDSDPVFPISNKSNTITGLYADLRPVIPFSPDTKLSLAVRTDFADSFGSRTIWKFGFRQPVGDFYIRGNGGTSYSLPRTNELFLETPTSIGNPNLKTEQTETFNGGIGFAKTFGDVQINAEIGAFRTNVTGRIQTKLPKDAAEAAAAGVINWKPGQSIFFNNTPVTEIRGLTADLDVLIGKGLSLNVNFTRQKAHLAGSDLQINETPEYMIGGNVAWHSPDNRFHLTLYPRYQGPEYATGGVNNALRHNFGNYFLLNGSIGFWAGDKQQHRFQLRLVNIFDEKYAERYGYGNMRFSSAFIRGDIKVNTPAYFYGYAFEGKPRSIYASYTTKF